jgi:hypothetical protein
MLKLDWCSHGAAKYAVEHWHYSHCLPMGKSVRVGVWEDVQFVGCVIFSRGANNNIGSPYALSQMEVCELTRVALQKHATPTTRILSIAIKLLRNQSPGVRLIVSYADPNHGHYGGIYQGMGWVYVGRSEGTHQLVIRGQVLHKRVARARYGTNDSRVLGGKYVYPKQKYKYLYPLDDAMRKQIAPLRKPYPKRATSVDSDTSTNPVGKGDASSTVALL